MPTLIAYLKLFRLPLVFTAIADSAAGYMVRRFYFPSALVMLCLAAASAGLYAFGMGMNDVADRERDKTLAPGRPLPSGRVSIVGALRACFGILAVSAVAILLARYVWHREIWWERQGEPSPLRLLCWIGAVATILCYDFLYKVPPVMGAVRALNFLMGYFVAETSVQDVTAGYFPGPELAFAPFVYGTSLTYISTLEDGPVKPGRVWIGTAGMIAGLAVPCILPKQITPALGPAGVLLLWILWRATRAVDKKGVMLMVRDGVAGFILLDASIVMSTGKVVEGTVLAALLIPAFGLMQIFKRLP
ncbi:MAG TPA: hypothetical protein VEJ18_07765 [Planctomycetota bacterium]|nr:hypothetical protein [Planctomycetota bacterium]